MSVNAAIKQALIQANMKTKDFATAWGTTAPVMSSKFHRESWSASDLLKVAKITGCDLVFSFPGGQQIIISGDAESAAPRGAYARPAVPQASGEIPPQDPLKEDI